MNFRDLGPCETVDGRMVASGRLFRSGRFEVLDRSDGDRLVRELGVTRLIDLRTADEIERAGELTLARRHAQVRVHHVPFFSQLGSPRAKGGTASAASVRSDPADAWQPRQLARRYVAMTVDTGRFSLARIVDILTGTGGMPAAFHCWSGKDRTGATAAVLLSLLGVADHVIAADYAATGEWFAAHLPDHPDLQSAPTAAAYDLSPETMLLTLEGLRSHFGSMEQMLLASGARSDQIETLRAKLLT